MENNFWTVSYYSRAFPTEQDARQFRDALDFAGSEHLEIQGHYIPPQADVQSPHDEGPKA